MEARTCTLTIISDTRAEYEDDLTYRRAEGRHLNGPLGGSRLTRDVAQILHEWIGDHPECRRRHFVALGRALYEIAFASTDAMGKEAGEIRRAFEAVYTLHKRLKYPLRLRLVLGQDATELAALPWEFLYIPPMEGESEGAFVASDSTELILTRFVPNADQFLRPTDDEDGRLRILVVISRPRIPGMTDIDDVDRFRQVILDLAHRDPTRFDIATPLESPDREQLSKRIEKFKPHIVHFIGHGRPGQLALRKDAAALAADEEAYLEAVQDGMHPEPPSEADWTDVITASAILRTGLQQADVPNRLVFLHSCQGASAVLNRSTLQGFASLAHALVSSEGISGVVAMQYGISSSQAEMFATAFYHGLSEGRPVDEAVTSARMQLAMRPAAGQQYWDDRAFGTPVIYLRREEPIVRPRPAGVPMGRAAAASSVAPDEAASVAVAGNKEHCPNPRCPDGYVLRTADPKSAFCRVCKRPFRACPVPGCSGLVVTVEGFICTTCDYTWGVERRAGAVDSATAPAQVPVVREGFVDAPASPRTSPRLGSQGPASSQSIEASQAPAVDLDGEASGTEEASTPVDPFYPYADVSP